MEEMQTMSDGSKFMPKNPEFDQSFVNAYGASSPLEERAEFASYMMMPRAHVLLLERFNMETPENEAILRRKYDAMKKDFFAWSAGKMDEAYWKALLAKASVHEYDADYSDYDSFYYDTFEVQK